LFIWITAVHVPSEPSQPLGGGVWGLGHGWRWVHRASTAGARTRNANTARMGDVAGKNRLEPCGCVEHNRRPERKTYSRAIIPHTLCEFSHVALIYRSIVALTFVFLYTHVSGLRQDNRVVTDHLRPRIRDSSQAVSCSNCDPAGTAPAYPSRIPFSSWERVRYVHPGCID
jgi:hypothetical protein